MKLVRHLRGVLPALFSLGLIAILAYWISLARLLWAFSQLDWQRLVPATVLMVLGLYLWDPLSMQVAFALGPKRLGYGEMLHVRGLTYLTGALNYELGRAHVAWQLARREGISIPWVLSQTALLAYSDLVVLLTMGWIGAALNGSSQALAVERFCKIGLGILVGGALALAWWRRTRGRPGGGTGRGAWLDRWSWRRFGAILALRAGYMGILLFYGAAALWIAGIRLGFTGVFSTIPIVIVASVLPNVSGLGTRETALYLLVPTSRPEVLMAISLIWSTGLLIGRLLIGVVHWSVARFLQI